MKKIFILVLLLAAWPVFALDSRVVFDEHISPLPDAFEEERAIREEYERKNEDCRRACIWKIRGDLIDECLAACHYELMYYWDVINNPFNDR